MTISGNLFSDELAEWFLEAGFKKSQCQMSIYYKYAPDGRNILFYLMFMIVYIGIHLKPSETWFVDTLGKRFNVNFLGYAYWLMSMIISHMKDHSI